MVAAILALGLMLASVPVAVSAAASGSKTPSLSADICHPLQSLDRAGDIVPMARPAVLASESTLTEFSNAPESPRAMLRDLVFTPDPPPPETLSL